MDKVIFCIYYIVFVVYFTKLNLLQTYLKNQQTAATNLDVYISRASIQTEWRGAKLNGNIASWISAITARSIYFLRFRAFWKPNYTANMNVVEKLKRFVIEW